MDKTAFYSYGNYLFLLRKLNVQKTNDECLRMRVQDFIKLFKTHYFKFPASSLAFAIYLPCHYFNKHPKHVIPIIAIPPIIQMYLILEN
jgi:hypothetical protein